MTSARVNPFENLDQVPKFEIKSRTAKPVDNATIEQLARDNDFPSRQPHRVEVPTTRKRRVFMTGRNRQLNFKATAATADRFYAMADKRGVKLCELLEQALDALEKAGA